MSSKSWLSLLRSGTIDMHHYDQLLKSLFFKHHFFTNELTESLPSYRCHSPNNPAWFNKHVHSTTCQAWCYKQVSLQWAGSKCLTLAHSRPVDSFHTPQDPTNQSSFLSFFERFISLHFMCINALSTHIYLYHVLAWYWGGQRRMLDLEFQVVLSWHVCAMNQTWVFYKNSKCSYQVSHLSSPVLDFLNTGDLIPQTWTDYSTQTWISFISLHFRESSP